MFCALYLAEALHLANLMCASGYIFPIDDHILTVKNDGAYYRFQVHLHASFSYVFYTTSYLCLGLSIITA